jgi:hypothetical protein
MADRYDKFTERARQALNLASEEATGLHQTYVAPEHILLALASIDDGLATKILEDMGVAAHKVRNAIGSLIASRVPRTDLPPGLTPASKKVVELAAEEARRLNHRYIGTEHLLLGLLREGESGAYRALEVLGVTYADARLEVMKLVASGPPQRRDPATRMVEEIRAAPLLEAAAGWPVLKPASQYRVETQWGGLFGGSSASGTLEELLNQRAAEGWRLVSAVQGIGYWWLIPRTKITYIWERLPVQPASGRPEPQLVPEIIGEEPD